MSGWRVQKERREIERRHALATSFLKNRSAQVRRNGGLREVEKSLPICQECVCGYADGYHSLSIVHESLAFA
eukprot:1379674-Amorphochlora_amoeboformis.AAC.1